MIYIENNTSKQLIYIPKNEDGCITHKAPSDCGECFDEGVEYAKSLMEDGEFFQNGDYQNDNGWSAITVNVPDSANLESKTVVIDQDTTIVIPSSGYDGMSSVFVDASDYGQGKYNEGVEDGFDDGYSSGYTQGSDDEKAKLGATGFTLNGDYTKPEGGWSSVTVNVEQSGHTDEELVEAYNSGYTSGQTHQKSLLTTTAFTENGQYTLANGWSAVTVDIEGLNIEPNKSFTATSNGNYTIEPTKWEVSYETYSNAKWIRFSKIGNSDPSENTLVLTVMNSDDEYSYVDIYLDDNGNFYYDDNWDISEYGRFYWYTQNGYQYLEFEDITFRDLDVIVEQLSGGYDSMSAVTVTVDVPSGMDITLSAITITENTAITASTGTAFSSITVDVPEPQCPEFNDGELEITTNGTYLSDDYGYDGFSSVTVNVPSNYGELYCLYCEDAEWNILGYGSTPYHFLANTLDNSDLIFQMSGTTAKSGGGVNANLKITYNEGCTQVVYDVDGNSTSGVVHCESSREFPNYNSYQFHQSTSSLTTEYISYVNPSYHPVESKVTTNKRIVTLRYERLYGSRYYLHWIYGGASECELIPSVDSNGYGRLRRARSLNTHFYPVSGYAWPVYRKKVNGVWKYTIVKQIVL